MATKKTLNRNVDLIDEATLLRTVERAIREERKQRINCGAGLVCLVTEAGSARFLHRYALKGITPTRWFDGHYPRDLTLADARRIRDADLVLLKAGRDPAKADRKASTDPTFGEFIAENFLGLCPPSQRKWAATPTRSVWFREMTQFVGSLARKKIDLIELSDVVDALEPYWVGGRPNGKATPTGRKMVFAIQRALKRRHAQSKSKNVPYSKWLTLAAVQEQLGSEAHYHREHPALDFEDAPAFVAKLRERETMSARLTEFIILTGVRANEAIGAKWGEIDFGDFGKLASGEKTRPLSRTWTIPPERLKTEQKKGEAGKPFVVPLSLAMIRVLRRAGAGLPCRPGDFIFPSFHHGRLNADRAYANCAPLTEVNLIDPSVTVHGFRSTLVGWGIAIDHRRRSPFDLEVMDRVLGHMIGAKKEGEEARLSKALARYARSGLGDPFIARRRIVMREWSRYLRAKPVQSPIRETDRDRSHLRLIAA